MLRGDDKMMMKMGELKKIDAVILACELAKDISMHPEFNGDVVAWQSFADLFNACATGNGILDAAKKFIDDVNTGYLWAGELPQNQKLYNLMELLED